MAKVKREPLVKCSYRLPAGVAAAVEKMAAECGWSDAKAAAFVLEAGFAGLFGKASEVSRLAEVGIARRKVTAAEAEARALVAKVRKSTAGVLRPKKPAEGSHKF